MYDFKNIKEGLLTGVVGLNDELEGAYIDFICKNNSSNILVVTSTVYEANKLYNTISNYTNNVYLFPMDDFIISMSSIASPEFKMTRLETINEIISNDNKNIIITNLMGYLRFLPLSSTWKNKVINLKVGEEINKEELFSFLCSTGYERETLVTKTGEISSRGYILDVFPIGYENAIRIEFFGDVIESIRYFNVDTQLSISNVKEVNIYPCSEFLTDSNMDVEPKVENLDKKSSIIEYLSKPIVVMKNYTQIYNSYLHLEDVIKEYMISNEISKKFMLNFEEISYLSGIYIMSVDDILPNVKLDNIDVYNTSNPVNFDDNIELMNTTLKDYLSLNRKVIICLDSDSEIKKVSASLTIPYVITDFNNCKSNCVNLVKKSISNGFIIDNIVVLSSNNIFKYKEKKHQYRTKFKYGVKIKSANSLNIGDYVVHNIHGIGIYEGIVALKKGNITKDYLQIKYKDNGKLYIPVEKIELISKYSSNEGIAPKINSLSNSDWQKTKLKVSGKLRDIASSLLKIAIERKTKEGFAFVKDDENQRMFENEFAYRDTKDQEKATIEIKKAMESPNPMDMLLCGDVGYGKTEVAFRAMFKAVCSKKQVAYLCPTTILSNQQYNAALERFKSFPVNIGLLNRFTTKKEVKNLIEKLKKGKIDILFGTHRILSDNVKFYDLGLLVVDEEQRFGVTHKEKIKKYKATIDVLTLSATPIPRTLQMSMVGIRDLVLIETPPNDRYPVQTYVLEENDYILKDAVEKELSRGGQVYILCNRIDSFDSKVSKIEKLIPNVKIGIAHGRMNKSEIEDIMYKFINGEFDVLLCTTIIETGIDIPNANTLIILDSDKFGLSQLYQIRGRVGRTNKIAYAYLMYEKHKVLSEVATKRLSAIKEFASLGSGFGIAMRDLSIRGAGDILGAEQSGFIDTIGIELYMKMLNDEVLKLKGIDVSEPTEDNNLLNVDTHIDSSYVKEDDLKIEIHKLINEIDSFESLSKIKGIIEDRFGKVSENIEIYMYEELFESMKTKKGIERVNQNDRFIEIIFTEAKTNSIKADDLFIKAYQISRNFKLGYKNRRLILTLNINNLDKHWIYYLIDILNSI